MKRIYADPEQTQVEVDRLLRWIHVLTRDEWQAEELAEVRKAIHAGKTYRQWLDDSPLIR